MPPLLACAQRGPARVMWRRKREYLRPRAPAGGPPNRDRSRAASALRMSRREMPGERQVAAPLMARRAAHGALRQAHRRFQPGEGVGVHLAGLRLSGKPQRPSQRQFGDQTPVLVFALIAPAASRPGQHRAVRRQRGRQVAPCGHASTVGQRFLRLVPRDDQEERSVGGHRGGAIAASCAGACCLADRGDPKLSGGPVLQLATIVAASAIR